MGNLDVNDDLLVTRFPSQLLSLLCSDPFETFHESPLEGCVHFPVPNLQQSAGSDKELFSVANSLRQVVLQHPRALHVVHLNAQSLIKHFGEVNRIFEDVNIDVIMISETWLRESLPDVLVSLKGFKFYKRSRLSRVGGGTAIYVRDDLKSKVIFSSSEEDGPECLFVEIELQGKKILVSVIYRPPKIKFITELEEMIHNYITAYEHVIIMGDFNCDLLVDTTDSRNLRYMLQSCNLSVLNSTPTHHSRHNGTLLDLIITNNPNKVLQYGQCSVPGISAHDLIYLSYSIRCPTRVPKIIKFRDYKSIDTSKLKLDAINMPWHLIYEETDMDRKVEMFNELILTIYDSHAPIRQVRVKHKPSPWLTDDIKSIMAERDTAFRHFKRNKTDETFETYRFLRNRTSQLIRNAKIRHTHERLSGETNTSQQWKFLRSLGIRDEKKRASVPSVSVENLNKHFTSPVTSIDAATKTETISSLNKSSSGNPEFALRTVGIMEVREALRRNKKKCESEDGINSEMINLILEEILTIITHIYNHSLMTGIFPKMWKLAIVHPIPKVQSPDLPGDYRAVSILPALSKGLEYIVHSQITEHLKSNNLLDSQQSGFRKGHSTSTALLKITEDISQAMDKKQLTILTLLDFSKAFDCVDRDILLAKLKKMNFSENSIQWTCSYLTNRYQRTVVEGNSSSWSEVTLGVPQGSILGPLYFCLFINDLSSSLRTSRYHLYADDLQIYNHTDHNSLNATIDAINLDLISLCDWTEKNGLKLNPSKSQAIIVGHRRSIMQIERQGLQNITIYNTKIKFTKTVKNLGITFDENLSWNDHVKNICQKVYRCLHPLKRLKKFLPQTIKTRLIQTLIMPIFDYCDVVYNTLGVDLAARLQRMHNTCIRYMLNLKLDDHISPVLKRNSWLNLKNRRLLHTQCLLHKLLCTSSPRYLSSRFNKLSAFHQIHTRSQTNTVLAIPRHFTSFYSKSFTISAARNWNTIPEELRQLSSSRSFKNKYKQLLLK